ncbi:minor capsid protein [Pseudolactococcus yaeyamensis]
MSDVSIKVDLKGIEKKLSPANLRRGKLAMSNQMLLDMERFVPRRDGTLRASGHAKADEVKYTAVYARAQFYGSAHRKGATYTFKRYSELGTGKRWDLKAKAKYTSQWKDTFVKGAGLK